MKYILTIIFLISAICCFGQIYKEVDTSNLEFHCLVAHGDDKGNVFTCDYNGHYFPAYIQDTTITKWFVKIDEKTKDSVFYFREYVYKTYVWEGKDKSKTGWYRHYHADRGLSEAYQGAYSEDSIRTRTQRWISKN